MDADERKGLQAFEVQPPGKHFNPKIPPRNGNEYLTHMLYERKRCPAVVSVQQKPLPIWKTVSLTWEEVCNQHSGIRHRASDKWKLAYQKLYHKVHEYVLLARAYPKICNATKVELPSFNDREGWIEFCKKHKPQLTYMLSMDQTGLARLLRILYKQMVCEKSNKTRTADNFSTNLYDKDRWMGYWLFAILHCLEMPCPERVLNTLRDIAYACIELKTLLSKDESNNACYYNMIIHFVAKYFKQTDLMDYL